MTDPTRSGWQVILREADGAIACARYDDRLRMWQLPYNRRFAKAIPIDGVLHLAVNP